MLCSIDGCGRPMRRALDGVCDHHRKRLPAITTEQRFRFYVDQSDAAGCWPFKGQLDRYGYGRYSIDGQKRSTHRLAYELAFGPVPSDLLVDHLCHGWDADCPGGVLCQHRRCCNPGHMELVTRGENVRRGHVARGDAEACRRGHAWTPENTGWRVMNGTRYRVCRGCQRDGNNRYRSRIAA